MKTNSYNPWLQHLAFVDNLKIIEYENSYTFDVFLDIIENNTDYEDLVFDTKKECENIITRMKTNPLLCVE